MAITNNIETDVKIKCVEANTTQVKLGKAIGSTGQYINRLIKNPDNLINKTFVKMLEALGYDITLTYTPRETNSNPSHPKDNPKPTLDLDNLLDD